VQRGPTPYWALTAAQQSMANYLDAALRAVTKAGGAPECGYVPQQVATREELEGLVGRRRQVDWVNDAAPPSPRRATAGNLVESKTQQALHLLNKQVRTRACSF